MSKRPLSVKVNYAFILLNLLIWLAIGIIIAADVHPALPDIPAMKGILATISLIIAGILLVLFIFLLKRNRIAFFLALGFFAAASLLTIFDDVGVSDIVVLVINIIPIILFIKDRAWYLQEKRNIDGSN